MLVGARRRRHVSCPLSDRRAEAVEQRGAPGRSQRNFFLVEFKLTVSPHPALGLAVLRSTAVAASCGGEALLIQQPEAVVYAPGRRSPRLGRAVLVNTTKLESVPAAALLV